MAASKPTDRHTHAHAQCSSTSVGLAQARPNYVVYIIFDVTGLRYVWFHSAIWLAPQNFERKWSTEDTRKHYQAPFPIFWAGPGDEASVHVCPHIWHHVCMSTTSCPHAWHLYILLSMWTKTKDKEVRLCLWYTSHTAHTNMLNNAVHSYNLYCAQCCSLMQSPF